MCVLCSPGLRPLSSADRKINNNVSFVILCLAVLLHCGYTTHSCVEDVQGNFVCNCMLKVTSNFRNLFLVPWVHRFPKACNLSTIRCLYKIFRKHFEKGGAHVSSHQAYPLAGNAKCLYQLHHSWSPGLHRKFALPLDSSILMCVSDHMSFVLSSTHCRQSTGIQHAIRCFLAHTIMNIQAHFEMFVTQGINSKTSL